MKPQTSFKSVNSVKILLFVFTALLFGGLSARAAIYTWTNAPVDANWGNTNNWFPKSTAYPGVFILGGSTQNGDTVIFNSALSGSIGGVGNPITIPNFGTSGVGGGVTNREVGSILFDTASCGAYVIGDGTTGLALTAAYNSTTFGSNVTVTATVASPVIFSNNVHFRYASSSNGGYQMTNNAALSTATLTFVLITNDSASSRPLTFILAGSNTGANTIGHFDDNNGANGSVHLVKSGTGRWVFPNANDFPQKTSGGDSIAANILVADGTLEVQNAGSLGTIAFGTLIVTNTGVLKIDAVTLNNNGITLKNGGTVQMNGSGTVNALVLSATAGNSGTLLTTSSGDILTATVVTNGLSDSVLHISGPGTVLVSSAPTTAGFLGKWSADAGLLQIGNASALGSGSAGLNISAGGTFDSSPITVGASYALTPAALSANGTGTTVGSTAAAIKADSTGTNALGSKPINLTYTPTLFTGDSTHPALYVSQGTLSLGGNTFTVNNASGTALDVGTYKLIQQASGNIVSGGSFAVNVTGSGLVAGRAAIISTTGGEVDMIVFSATPKNLTWTGGNPDGSWDITTKNWDDGVEHTNFFYFDNVIFNSEGQTNPTVTLSGGLQPSTLLVDTVSNNYTFTGSGSIVGTTALIKASTNKLILGTVNTYSGGTVISNGFITINANNAIPGAGSGDVKVVGTGTLDLNTFSDTVGALNGNGTVDDTGGGTSVLTVGNNNNSGTFSGVIQNTLGSLAIVKAGNGTETLAVSNSFSGGATVNAGVLKVTDPNALGTNTLTVNSGTLDMATNLIISGLSGSGGTVANNSTTTANTLTVLGTAATTYSGNVVDGSGGGTVAIQLLGGTLSMGGINTYSGGTIVAGGATFGIPNSPASVGGSVIASNNATLALSGGSGTPGTPTNVLTVDGASVSFTSGALGKIWGAQFVGSATATNRIINPISAGGDSSYKNFFGVVSLEQVGDLRFINIPTGAAGGGDAATFAFVADGSIILTRDAATVRLGNITGGTPNSGIDTAVTAGAVDTYILGGKGVDTAFNGFVRGLNNIVKAGTGTLAFSGGFVTNVSNPSMDGFTFVTNVSPLALVTYTGNTTISNGVFKLNAPNILTNSPNITLAASTAVLDASSMGWVSNDTDNLTYTNQVLITNGVFEVISGQKLNGVGTIRAVNVLLDSGSTLNVGAANGTNGTGTLTLTNTGELAGVVNMTVSDGSSPNASQLVAQGFTIDGTATLVVTNAGAALQSGDTFQLFNHPVSGFSSVTLNNMTVSSPLFLTNKLSVDGSIGVISLVNTTPTNINVSISGGNINLSWPTDRIGWGLQVQTNTLGLGLQTNSSAWFDVPGSSLMGQTNFPINPNNGAVFYRMIYPPNVP